MSYRFSSSLSNRMLWVRETSRCSWCSRAFLAIVQNARLACQHVMWCFSFSLRPKVNRHFASSDICEFLLTYFLGNLTNILSLWRNDWNYEKITKLSDFFIEEYQQTNHWTTTILIIGNVDVSKMELLDVVSIDDIWLEYVLLDKPEYAGKGLCVIVDIHNYSWKMLKWLTPDIVRNCVRKLQTMPYRDYRFHIVKKSHLINTVMKFILPFLPQYIKDMVSLKAKIFLVKLSFIKYMNFLEF